MSTCKTTIEGILQRNGLDRPDGRHLCMYRCTDKEYSALTQTLKSVVVARCSMVPHRTDHEAALFCLYASEWWRRTYSSGPWSWSGILESIGLDPDTPRIELYDPVRCGLRYWQRKLLTVGDKNVYLVTVACEGGLPLNLLMRQENSHIRQYLRALLREFRVYGGTTSTSLEIASRLGDYLPRSLRQKPLFQICGEVIEKIWHLQKRVEGSAKPAEDLDRREPGWRGTFPMVVPDDVARSLLNSLVNEAVKIARIQELLCVTTITRTGKTFSLHRTVKLPTSIDVRSLAHLLSIPSSSLPYQLQLFLAQPMGDPRFLGLITRRTAGEEGKFAIETPTGGSQSMEGDAATQSTWLEIRSTRLNLEVRDMIGGLGLSSLPWSFVERDTGSGQWELVGEGSLKTKFQEILLAVTSDMEIACLEGNAEQAGVLDAIGRNLVRVSGVVKVRWKDGMARISTRSPEEESAQYSLSGAFLSSGVLGSTIYRGFPKILCQKESGSSVLVPADQIEWKTRSANDPWKKGANGCCGPVVIRLAQDDGIRFMAELDLVPEESKLTFVPGQNTREGSIVITAMGAVDYGVFPTTGVSVTQSDIGGGRRLDFVSVVEPPATLPLHLRWNLGQELVLRVPYPAMGVRFLARDGSILSNGATVHLEQMSGVTVQMMDPNPLVRYKVEASAVGNPDLFDDTLILLQSAPGRHEIDLRMLQESCDLMLSGMDTLDAKIKIRVISDRGKMYPQNIEVARYDITLEPCRISGEVIIPEDEVENLPVVCDKLSLRAFPLADPLCEPEELESTGQGRWRFAEERRAAGPWLITGWDGDWCRVRPLCWTIGEPPLREETDDVRSLAEVVAVAGRGQRELAFRDFVQVLADNPGHSDWKRVDGYFPHIKALPPSSFDIIQSLVRKKKASAMALLRAGEEMFDTVWVGLERLPFAWHLISVDAWLYAASLRKDYLVESLAPLLDTLGGTMEPLIEASFSFFFKQAPVRVHGFESIIELLKSRLFHADLGPLQSCLTQTGRHMLRPVCLAPEEQEMMQRHADDLWPIAPDLLMEWWTRSLEVIPPELASLWNVGGSFRASVINAPIAAAFSAGFNLNVPRKLVLKLRALRNFDQQWFDNAYGCVLAMCIGYRIENKTI